MRQCRIWRSSPFTNFPSPFSEVGNACIWTRFNRRCSFGARFRKGRECWLALAEWDARARAGSASGPRRPSVTRHCRSSVSTRAVEIDTPVSTAERRWPLCLPQCQRSSLTFVAKMVSIVTTRRMLDTTVSRVRAPFVRSNGRGCQRGTHRQGRKQRQPKKKGRHERHGHNHGERAVCEERRRINLNLIPPCERTLKCKIR